MHKRGTVGEVEPAAPWPTEPSQQSPFRGNHRPRAFIHSFNPLQPSIGGKAPNGGFKKIMMFDVVHRGNGEHLAVPPPHLISAALQRYRPSLVSCAPVDEQNVKAAGGQNGVVVHRNRTHAVRRRCFPQQTTVSVPHGQQTVPAPSEHFPLCGEMNHGDRLTQRPHHPSGGVEVHVLRMASHAISGSHRCVLQTLVRTQVGAARNNQRLPDGPQGHGYRCLACHAHRQQRSLRSLL